MSEEPTIYEMFADKVEEDLRRFTVAWQAMHKIARRVWEAQNGIGT